MGMRKPSCLNSDSTERRLSWNNLIELYEVWNKTKAAQQWRAKLPQTKAVEQ
jgi:hypothetical protein